MTPGAGESTLEEVGAMLDDLAETNTQQTNPNAPAQTQTAFDNTSNFTDTTGSR